MSCSRREHRATASARGSIRADCSRRSARETTNKAIIAIINFVPTSFSRTRAHRQVELSRELFLRFPGSARFRLFFLLVFFAPLVRASTTGENREIFPATAAAHVTYLPSLGAGKRSDRRFAEKRRTVRQANETSRGGYDVARNGGGGGGGRRVRGLKRRRRRKAITRDARLSRILRRLG